MEALIIYPVFIWMAIPVAQMARQRGYSGRWWFLIGLLLPIVSIFIVRLLKPKQKQERPLPFPAEIPRPVDKVLFSRES
ncbi:MAG: hypothetical protein V4590_04805 [Bacteroidota bacterium]